MQVRQVAQNREGFLPLLLEADPDEGMIARYLHRGRLYVLEEGGKAIAVAVVTAYEGEVGACELKNIAVDPKCQRRGFGTALLRAVMAAEGADFSVMYVGTTAPVEPFYRALGFAPDHIVKNFFLDHYPAPIFENGVQAVDMRYLKRRIGPIFGRSVQTWQDF